MCQILYGKVKKAKNLTIMIAENLNHRSCGRNVCSHVDVAS